MKKHLLFSLTLCLSFFAKAQITFSDNFDSYTAGSLLCPQSTTWVTWTSAAGGGADDVNVASSDAHTPSNSLYFTTTAATGGGPADILLPFGGLHNKGTFSYSHWMKIPAGKKAYFNFQGTATAGQTYTMNYTFNTTAKLTIDDASNVTLSTVYPQGVWFKFQLEANLNTNEWELLIDGVSKGKFQNSTFQISSLDYYSSDNTNSFWIDDVSYTHTPYTLPTRNGAMAIVGIDNGVATQSRAATITIRNLGINAITSFDIGLNANGNNNTQSFTGLNIASGASHVVTLNAPITLISGLNTFTATIKNVNGTMADDDAADDSKTITFTPVTPGVDKLVIGEEATGTWCQWCPRGAVALRNMDKKYNGFFQGIAVHNADPMEVPAYDSGIGTKISGYPSGLVDRLPKIDPSAFETDFLQRVVLTPIAKLKNGATYNSTTGQLEVSISTTFKSAASGNYKMVCVLIEDSVKGTGAGYNQSNAYAGGASGVMGGFELLPASVPASQMIYDHTARAIAPDFFGIPNAFPSIVVGTPYAHNFSFNIATWNKSRMHIIGMLIAPDGKIENASSTNIDDAVLNGYVLNVDQVASKPNIFSVFPNPTMDAATILLNMSQENDALITLSDVQGKVLLQQKQHLLSGANKIPLSLNNLAAGLYLVNASIGNEVYSVKVEKK